MKTIEAIAVFIDGAIKLTAELIAWMFNALWSILVFCFFLYIIYLICYVPIHFIVKYW